MCLLSICKSFLKKYPLRSSSPILDFFFFFILSYIDTELCAYFGVVLFPNIFSHSIDCLFVLLLFFFAVQKLLSLIRSHLFIFAFISVILGDGSNVAAIYAKECCAQFPPGVL